MDPDIVRQQEEAEREARAAAQKKLANDPAAPAAAKAAFPSEAKAEHPDSSARPPVGSGWRPGEASAKPRRPRRLQRLFVYALAGAALGAATGYAAMLYMNWM